MNVIVISSLVIVGTVILGALLAIVFRGFSSIVVKEQQEAAEEKSLYNPALTYGYKIPVGADSEAQMKAARKEAARQAAATPRGANLGIGRANGGKQVTAYQGVKNDPVSAVKIANVHSWEGMQAGSAFSPAHTTTHADAVTAPPTKSVEDLVPGKDFPVIEITEDMTPAEKRKARIANAKAKSAAAKALKSAPSAAQAAPVAVPAAAPAAAATAVPGAASPATIKEPVAGVDYEVIEITDDMSPDEVRKARIANVKAKSAANKAFKAAGIAAPAQAAATPQPSPPAAAQSAAAQSPVTVAPPDLIEITDDMAPDEIRKARIHNAKAKGAYKKALKEAGIDPKSVA